MGGYYFLWAWREVRLTKKNERWWKKTQIVAENHLIQQLSCIESPDNTSCRAFCRHSTHVWSLEGGHLNWAKFNTICHGGFFHRHAYETCVWGWLHIFCSYQDKWVSTIELGIRRWNIPDLNRQQIICKHTKNLSVGAQVRIITCFIHIRKIHLHSFSS